MALQMFASAEGKHRQPPQQVQEGTYWPKRAHTMIGGKRLRNIRECFESVLREGVEGDLIETGVWRGGATIYMAVCVRSWGREERSLLLILSRACRHQIRATQLIQTIQHHTVKFLAVDLETVKENFRRYGLLSEDVVFVKGFFETSLCMANPPIEKLAILRLDGDMYSSTIQVLDQLYDKVSPGGYIIIDDYGELPNCRAAVTDFRAKRGITTPLVPIDASGVYWRK